MNFIVKEIINDVRNDLLKRGKKVEMGDYSQF